MTPQSTVARFPPQVSMTTKDAMLYPMQYACRLKGTHRGINDITDTADKEVMKALCEIAQ
jgi:hypothetical protein